MRKLTSLVVSLASLVAVGGAGCTPGSSFCGAHCVDPSGSDGGVVPTGAVNVTPSTVTLTVNGAAAMQQFSAVDRSGGALSGCTWTVTDAALGTVTPTGLYKTAYPLPHGGNTYVQASCGGKMGSATVTINYVSPDVVDPSAPPDAPMAFTGPPSTDPSEMARVVYPFDGTMLARNINQMNLQWSASPKDKLHRIHIVGPAVDISFFVGCSTQCSYKFKDSDWKIVALSASGAGATLTISSTAGAGQPVATAAPLTLHFSPEDVQGGLYYFSTSTRGLKRLPFGASQATDFIPNGNSFGCVGCHSVSRDGKKVAATFGGGDGYAGIVDGANGQKYLLPVDQARSQYAWNFSSFSPDGSKLVTNWTGKLEIRDSSTGALIKAVPQSQINAKYAVMPEWSPDGNSIAFVGVPAEGVIGKDMSQFGNLLAGDWILANGGSIMVMPYNGGNFGPAQKVVPSVTNSEYHFYPSWSPDSQWLVFATGKYPGSSPTAANNGVDLQGRCTSYDQDTARLRLVKAGGGAVIELTAATHAANHTSSWPKFTPFIQNGGQLVFITFSSKFNYGFIVPEKAQPQIWMSAIDLNKANAELGNGDPSYPPFWLPFQDPHQNNHSTIWTNDVACTGAGGDCPPEFTCQNGVCVPPVG